MLKGDGIPYHFNPIHLFVNNMFLLASDARLSLSISNDTAGLHQMDHIMSIGYSCLEFHTSITFTNMKGRKLFVARVQSHIAPSRCVDPHSCC